MKIVQLQNTTKSAGSSAIRLHNAFLDAGIDATIVSLNKDNIVDSRFVSLDKKARLRARLSSEINTRRTKKKYKAIGSFTYPVLGTDVSKIQAVRNADVIYIHWVLGGFMGFNSFEKLFKLRKPVVIVMHDMFWITGGCHYSLSCRKYESECMFCPVLQSNKKADLSNKGFKKKQTLYNEFDNLYFISPSKWLYNEAKKSALLQNKPVFYIPNAIDQTVFKPFDKNTAKEILNLPLDQKVLAFGAVRINSPYKGWPYLEAALKLLAATKNTNDYTVIIFGSGFNEKIAALIPFTTKFLGFLDEIALTVAYNAADVFIVPSMADNQPTVVMESLCCGTPVVGFDVGGIPDMIEHKQNGYLAEYKNSNDLVDGIIYSTENRLDGKPLPSFKRDIITGLHLELLKSILN